MTDEQQMELLAGKIAGRLESKMDQYIAAQTERCQHRQTIIAEHHRALFGNGTPGLKARMDKQAGWLCIIGFLSGASFVAVITAVANSFL